MSKKRVLVGMLVIVSTFGVLVTGCKSSGKPKDDGKGGSGPERVGEKSILEWVKADGIYPIGNDATLQFMGETWVQTVKGSPLAAGSLTGMPGIPPGIDVAAIEAKIAELKAFAQDVINALESADQDMANALTAAKNMLNTLEDGNILTAVKSCQELVSTLQAARASLKGDVITLLETAQSMAGDLVNMANEFAKQWTDFLNNATEGKINLTATMIYITGKWQTMEQVDKLMSNPVASKAIPQAVKDSVAKFKQGITFSYKFSNDPPFLVLSAN
jgi:hypothetical protein